MSDKNCQFWSDSEHMFMSKTVIGKFDEFTINNKEYTRKVCLCGVHIKSRDEIRQNPLQVGK